MPADGGVKPITGWPASASWMVSATMLIGCGDRPSPGASPGLSGSATKLAPASCGVTPTNQAAVVESVVPVLPANGRPTAAIAPGAVDQPPQSPAAGWSPVVQRIASIAACATSGLTAWVHCGSAPGTGFPSVLVVMERTGDGAQNLPSAATVAYAPAISSGVVSATPSVNGPQPTAWSGCARPRSTSLCHVRPSRSAMATALSAPTRSSTCTQ